MIEIAPETACILYLALCLSIVLTIWCLTKKKEVAKFELKSRSCDFCNYHYLEEIDRPISRCPQCQLLNKKR